MAVLLAWGSFGKTPFLYMYDLEHVSALTEVIGSCHFWDWSEGVGGKNRISEDTILVANPSQ